MSGKEKSLKGGSWTSSQWYSDQRLSKVPRYWQPNDESAATHLAYITDAEIELLKKQSKKQGEDLVSHTGPFGVPFFASPKMRIENTSIGGEKARNVPIAWKSSPDHPMARLVYVTDEQAEFLKKMDIHDSGVDEHDHYGPDNVPSYQGDGGGGDGGGGGGDGGGGGGDGGGGMGNDASAGDLGGMGASDLGSIGAGDLGSIGAGDLAGMSASDLGSIGNFGESSAEVGQSEVSAIDAANLDALGNLSSAEVGKAEMDAIANAIDSAGGSKGTTSASNFSLSNLTARDALMAAALASTGPLGATIAGLGLAGKASGNAGLSAAGQALGIGANLASGNVLGAASGILGITGAANASLGSTGSGSVGQDGTSGQVGGDSGQGIVDAGPSTSAGSGETTTGGGSSGRASFGSQALSFADILAGLMGAGAASRVIQTPEIETSKKPGLPVYETMNNFEGPLDQFLGLVERGSYADLSEQQQAKNRSDGMQQDRLDETNYFSYGAEPNIDSNLFGDEEYYRFFEPNIASKDRLSSSTFMKSGGLAVPLMAEGGNTWYGRYAGGGLNVVEHSGKHRLDFRKGAAVTGPGDGQSDDIPAMLADGEFVFPADVVAALGNGSTKAGSDKLYDMMHAIRAHHRSAKPEDLPPPAKESPLDYLKKPNRKVRS
jgi:hypothetical protein